MGSGPGPDPGQQGRESQKDPAGAEPVSTQWTPRPLPGWLGIGCEAWAAAAGRGGEITFTQGFYRVGTRATGSTSAPRGPDDPADGLYPVLHVPPGAGHEQERLGASRRLLPLPGTTCKTGRQGLAGGSRGRGVPTTVAACHLQALTPARTFPLFSLFSSNLTLLFFISKRKPCKVP